MSGLNGTNGTAVAVDQRFNRNRPCPICGSHQDAPRHRDERCVGYLSGSGKFAFCGRVPSTETVNSAAGPLYKHRVAGECPCGAEHSPGEPKPAPIPSANGNAKKGKTIHPGPEKAIRALLFGVAQETGDKTWKATAKHFYKDKNGTSYAASIRIENAAGDKQHRPISRVKGGGGWIVGAPEGGWMLYNLPLLDGAKMVIVCEGEKAANAAESLGFVSTTSAHGSGSAHKTDWSGVAGVPLVVIWPDADESGEHYANDALGQLAQLDPRPEVRIIRPNGMPEGGDAADWVEAGRDATKLQALIDAAPPVAFKEPESFEDEVGFDFQIRTAAQLNREEFPREYLVDGVLVARQPCIVGGPRKALKTSVMVALGLALASGRDFLGRFRVPNQQRVLFLSGESGEATTQETVRRVSAEMGVDLDDLADHFQIGFRLPSLSNAQQLAALGRQIQRSKAEVVIIDPLYLCLLDDNPDLNEASLFKMGPLLVSIARACLDAGATPILVHHFRKNRDRPDAPPELEDLAFAGVQEFARQWLLLGRRTAYTPGTGKHDLWLVYGGSAGHSGSWALDVEEGVADDNFQGRSWSVTLTSAGEAREAAQARRVAAKEESKREIEAKTTQADAVNAADLLRKEGPLVRTRIRDRLGLSPSRLERALQLAESQGWIEAGDIERPWGREGKGTKLVPGYTYRDQSIPRVFSPGYSGISPVTGLSPDKVSPERRPPI